MLKQRLLTAAILIPLVVLAILKLPTNIFQWLIAGVTLLAAWEWFTIVGLQTISQRVVMMAGLGVISALSLVYLPVSFILTLVVLIWLLATVLIVKYAHTGLPDKLAILFNQTCFGTINAVLVLVPFLLAVIWLHEAALGPQQLLYVMVSVWLADTGGYFAGKKWGKDKLAKVISPNKTWQGVYGALALTSIWAVLAYLLNINGSLSLLAWLGLTLVTVLISIVGDLFESLFKRAHQVKDSGNLLPGHGGILDRIDSLIAAVPIFVAGLAVLGAL